MTTFTDVLVSWPLGWERRRVTPEAGQPRIETVLGLTATVLAEVQRDADAELATYGAGQIEITVGTDPTGDGDRAGTDYRVGDVVTVDGQDLVVEAITVQVDDETGRAVRVPQFGTVLDTAGWRQHRATQKHLIGSVAGTSRVAVPVASVPSPTVRPGTGST